MTKLRIRALLVLAAIGLFGIYQLLTPTRSPAQTADPVFVGAGDIADCSRTQDEATAKLLDVIEGTIYTVGDNAYPNGTLAEFNNCYGPTWGRHKARTQPSAGNHEYNTSGAMGHYTYFGSAASPQDTNCTANCRGYYSYNLGAWHIIALNSEIDHAAGSAQEQWLRSDLAANPTACTLAYWHKPRFSSGSGHGNDTTFDSFWRALYQYGADVVLNGHDHNYERFAPQSPDAQAQPTRGIREFVVGTGGASLRGQGTVRANSQVRNFSAHGVLKLTLHATSYDWQFVPVAGQSFTDTGSSSCVSAGTPTPTSTSVLSTGTPTPANTAVQPTPTRTLTPTPTRTSTPQPTPTSTPVPPIGTPVPGGFTVTLQAADGWDSKLQKLLSQDGKLYTVQTSDNVRWETEAGRFTSLRFQGGIPANATIQSATLFIEHHQEEGITGNSIRWEVGGGLLTNPTMIGGRVPQVLPGESAETTVEWNVTADIDSAAEANDLKLVIRNNDTNGKKTKLDRARLQISYTVP